MFRAGQPTFSGLEIGPALVARTDTAKYQTALRRARNVQGLVAGGVTKRQGFGYVGQLRDSTQIARLVPFQFDIDQAYVLEFGPGTIRFISEGGYILESALTITAITQSNPAVVTCPGHPYIIGDVVYFSGILGMTQINGGVYKVTTVTGPNYTINLNTTGYSAFTGDTGGAPYVAPVAPTPAPPGVSTPPSTTPDPVTSPPLGGGGGRYKAP